MNRKPSTLRARMLTILGVRGADGPQTLTELEDERGRVLTALDDIVETARSENRGFTDEERAEHDRLVARHDELDGDIARARQFDADQDAIRAHQQRREVPVPMVNLNREAPSANRSLDEMFWATDEAVRASGGNALHDVEQVVIRSEASGTETVAPRISEFLPEHRSVVRAFQNTVADMALFGLLVDKDARSSRQGFEVARSHRLFRDRYQSVLRAMDVDTSGEGGTWVPTGIGADLHEKVRASGKIAPLFARVDIPTNPWKWPIEGTDATAYRVGEPTGDTESKPTASTPGTVAATFDAEIFGARALISRSLEADSAVAILPYVRQKLVQAFVDAEEKAILDGDSDGTHQDSDIGASTTAAVTAWDGLRKRALAETTQATTTTSVANLAAIRKKMGKWGVNPADLAFIIGVSSYGVLLSDSNVLTVDKMGPQATILNGQVASLFGVPIIVSEWVREDLNASGVYDGITTTKTYALCVNRMEWAMGQRMALDVEVDDSIYRETYQRVLVSFMREDFQSIASVSTDDNTSIGYNITSGS